MKKILKDITCYFPDDSPNDSSEYAEQVNIINWFRYNHPTGFIYSVVNERQVPVGMMVKLKKSGLKKGIPDLHFFINGKSYFVELKRESAKWRDVRESQIEVLTELQKQKANVAVCFGFEAFKEFMKDINA